MKENLYSTISFIQRLIIHQNIRKSELKNMRPSNKNVSWFYDQSELLCMNGQINIKYVQINHSHFNANSLIMQITVIYRPLHHSWRSVGCPFLPRPEENETRLFSSGYDLSVCWRSYVGSFEWSLKRWWLTILWLNFSVTFALVQFFSQKVFVTKR